MSVPETGSVFLKQVVCSWNR